jgi:hypothetical protein
MSLFRESINKAKSTLNTIKETSNNIALKFAENVASILPKKIIDNYIDDKINQRVKESIVSEDEDSTWRRITSQERDRDLSPLKQDKMIKIVDWLRERNPMAGKILTLYADFVLGDGVKIKADKVEGREKEQEAFQGEIDKFWKMNDWELTQFDKIEELSGYGEQIYHANVNDMNGDIMLSPCPPETINKVLKDKKFYSKLDKIVFYSRFSESEAEKTKDIIRMRPNVLRDTTNETQVEHGLSLQGDVFFFSVNRGTFGTRGKSDILSLADWLDIYDRTLYTMTERVVFLLSFLWDITIEGAGEEELKKRKAELQLDPPTPGSFNFHNQREKWEPSSPDLKGRDFQDHIKTVMNMLSGGSRFPEHWLFGRGENTNKASASEMSEPTLRQMKRRQKYVTFMFRQMIDYLIQQKINKGIFKGSIEDFPYTVIIPEASKKEASIIAEAFAKMAPALSISTMNEFLSNETATKVLSTIIEQMGIEVDIAAEIKKAKENPDLQAENVQEAIKNFVEQIEKKKNEKQDTSKR